MKEKNQGDINKIEDKYFKESIPGLNRLLNILKIPGKIVEILPTEYQNYRQETKHMDLCLLLDIDETLNLEFKSTYIKREDIVNSLDYATYLRIKYEKKTNSYFISTKKMKDSKYEDDWHNDNKYIIPLKTFKELDADEHLRNLKKLIKNNKIDDKSEEVNDLLLIPFMKSNKSPKELIVKCIKLANQITTVNRDKLNDIKNLLKFLATKYTDTEEEYEEIERLVKMEGGMIETTVNQMRRIYKEEGIREGTIKERQRGNQKLKEERQKSNLKLKIMEEELNRRGIKNEDIEEARKKAEQEIEKIK